MIVTKSTTLRRFAPLRKWMESRLADRLFMEFQPECLLLSDERIIVRVSNETLPRAIAVEMILAAGVMPPATDGKAVKVSLDDRAGAGDAAPSQSTFWSKVTAGKYDPADVSSLFTRHGETIYTFLYSAKHVGGFDARYTELGNAWGVEWSLSTDNTDGYPKALGDNKQGFQVFIMPARQEWSEIAGMAQKLMESAQTKQGA